MRTIMISVIALLAAGCTSSTGGGPVSTGAATHSAAAASSDAPTTQGAPPNLTSLRRSIQHASIGDVVRADLCAYPLAGMRRLGSVGFPTRQRFARCDVALAVDKRTTIQIETRVESPGGDYVPASAYFRRGHGSIVGTWIVPAEGDDCPRAVQVGRTVYVTSTPTLYGKVPRRTSCAAATAAMTAQERAYASGPLPLRPLATKSLTRFDACRLMMLGGARRAPGLHELSGATPGDGGAGCIATSGQLSVNLSSGLVVRQSLANRPAVTVRTHSMRVNSLATLCDVTAVANHATGGVWEFLDVTVSGAATKPALCRAAEQALSNLLDTLGLH